MPEEINEPAKQTVKRPSRGKPFRKGSPGRTPNASMSSPGTSASDEAKLAPEATEPKVEAKASRPTADKAETKTETKERPQVEAKGLPAFVMVAPLIQGESLEEYWELFDRIVDAVEPTDRVEELYVKDIADTVWDMQRARLLRAKFIEVVRSEGRGNAQAQGILAGRGLSGFDLTKPDLASPEVKAGLDDIRAEHAKAAAGEISPAEAMQTLLAKGGALVDYNRADVRSYVDAVAQLKEVDALIAGCARRRDLLLREVEHRRGLVAARVRNALSDFMHVQALKEQLPKEDSPKKDSPKSEPPQPAAPDQAPPSPSKH